MTVFDAVATWVCRVWAATILLALAAIAAAAVGGRIYDWRERRRDVRRVRELARAAFTHEAIDIAEFQLWARQCSQEASRDN
jgi:hypothetical protein